MKQKMGKLNVRISYEDCILMVWPLTDQQAPRLIFVQTFVQIFGTKVLGGFLQNDARNGEAECLNMI